jgi:hypothetical protein
LDYQGISPYSVQILRCAEQGNGLLLVAGVVGAVQREVAQRRELRLDAV